MENRTVETLYGQLAHQIEREDGLINTRITWMLTFEGFLFAALALVADKESDQTIQFALKYALPLIGLVVAILAFFAIGAALSVLATLKKQWDPAKFPDHIRPFGGDEQHAMGAAFARGLPTAIAVLWLIMFCWFLYSDACSIRT